MSLENYSALSRPGQIVVTPEGGYAVVPFNDGSIVKEHKTTHNRFFSEVGYVMKVLSDWEVKFDEVLVLNNSPTSHDLQVALREVGAVNVEGVGLETAVSKRVINKSVVMAGEIRWEHVDSWRKIITTPGAMGVGAIMLDRDRMMSVHNSDLGNLAKVVKYVREQPGWGFLIPADCDSTCWDFEEHGANDWIDIERVMLPARGGGALVVFGHRDRFNI